MIVNGCAEIYLADNCMRVFKETAFGIIAFSCVIDAALGISPVMPGPDGQRAFDDLAGYYSAKTTPEYQSALNELKKDPLASLHASAYLLALLEQSAADETNGRTGWHALPFWNGGAENRARDVRSNVAKAIGTYRSPEVLPAALWLVEHDLVEDDIVAGANAVGAIHNTNSDAAIGDFLKEPHPSQSVLTMALAEVGSRRLVEDKEAVIALEQSYRPSVRQAARSAAQLLGETHAEDYDVHGPLPPRMLEFLKANGDRLLDAVPNGAVWQQGRIYSQPFGGWLIKDSGSTVVLLDWLARESSVARNDVVIKAGTLQASAADLVAHRSNLNTLSASLKNNQDVWDRLREKRAELSRRGFLSAQFEPPFISLPEITVAVWSWQHGDTDSCRRILDGCFSAADDDRWLDQAARDYLGDLYNREMVEAYCDDEDDVATLRLAKHLSRPIFDGYGEDPVLFGARLLALRFGKPS
jgi:hypothetical protein